MSPALGSRIKQWWLPALLVAGFVLFFASGAHRAISWQTIALHYGQITAYTEANLAMAAVSFLLLYAVAVAFSLPIALPLTLLHEERICCFQCLRSSVVMLLRRRLRHRFIVFKHR